jgi:RloB-like protein
MTLNPRRPRPLTRDAASLRDDRLFIVACDDTFAPKQYFNFFRLPRVQIHVVETPDGTSAAMHVLDRLLRFDHEEDDERWMLLDTDHCTQGTHLGSFLQALREAQRQGVHVAVSRPSFELWLLLHHLDENALGVLQAAKDVETALRSVIGEYNKTNLKRAHYPLPSVRDACLRAERLDNTVAGCDIPTGNTTRVYLLWKAIVAKALPQQLPLELRGLWR